MIVIEREEGKGYKPSLPGQWMVDFEVRMRLLEADGRCEESGRDGGGVAGGGRSVDVLAGSAGRRRGGSRWKG